MPLLWRLLLVVSTFVCLSSANLDQTSFKGHHAPSKRIAIVGMGAAGVSSLKAIMSLPEDMRAGWEVVAFEQREAVGGLWLLQDEPPSPPEAPATPLYPDLRTNGPHPYQTLPHIPFPPETPLLAPHATVLQYYQDIIIQANLSSYIQLQHAVQRAEWVGNSATGYWDLIVEHVAEGTTSHYQFDHLIAGPGVNRFPAFPVFAGQDEWSAANKTIFHCAYFRDADTFDGQNVVIVGGGPSGWDMVRHLAGHAKKVHWSRDTKADNPAAPGWPPQPGVPDMPRIASLAGGVVTFRDGTVLRDVDTILLATGYDLRIPFLTAGGHLPELDRGAEQSPDYLTSNGRYIYPLYEHTLSLDPTYPLGALYFVGLVLYNPTGMTDYAQALWTAYTLADPRLLASRMELLIALEARESRIRKEGFDPARLGHKVFVGYGAFQGHEENGSHDDLLVHHLRDNGYAGFPGIPPAGVNYTDPWRLEVMRFGAQPVYAWIKGEERVGKQEWNERWSKGRETEEDYVEELKGIMKWWEKVKGSNLTMN